jgi:hypothetical protein
LDLDDLPDEAKDEHWSEAGKSEGEEALSMETDLPSMRSMGPMLTI